MIETAIQDLCRMSRLSARALRLLFLIVEQGPTDLWPVEPTEELLRARHAAHGGQIGNVVLSVTRTGREALSEWMRVLRARYPKATVKAAVRTIKRPM